MTEPASNRVSLEARQTNAGLRRFGSLDWVWFSTRRFLPVLLVLLTAVFSVAPGALGGLDAESVETAGPGARLELPVPLADGTAAPPRVVPDDMGSFEWKVELSESEEKEEKAPSPELATHPAVTHLPERCLDEKRRFRSSLDVLVTRVGNFRELPRGPPLPV